LGRKSRKKLNTGRGSKGNPRIPADDMKKGESVNFQGTAVQGKPIVVPRGGAKGLTKVKKARISPMKKRRGQEKRLFVRERVFGGVSAVRKRQ